MCGEGGGIVAISVTLVKKTRTFWRKVMHFFLVISQTA